MEQPDYWLNRYKERVAEARETLHEFEREERAALDELLKTYSFGVLSNPQPPLITKWRELIHAFEEACRDLVEEKVRNERDADNAAFEAARDAAEEKYRAERDADNAYHEEQRRAKYNEPPPQ